MNLKESKKNQKDVLKLIKHINKKNYNDMISELTEFIRYTYNYENKLFKMHDYPDICDEHVNFHDQIIESCIIARQEVNQIISKSFLKDIKKACIMHNDMIDCFSEPFVRINEYITDSKPTTKSKTKRK